MNILISNYSDKPIYEQITNQIKNSILTGELRSNDPLPSMRTLAKELRISVITTKRAYEELEHDGFITSIPGKGSFVTGMNPELVREEHLRKIEEKLQEVIDIAQLGGISDAELLEIMHTFLNSKI